MKIKDFQKFFGSLFYFTEIRLYLNSIKIDFETPIEFIKGIGPERAKFIRNVLGITTVEDFLTFYPLRYIDKSKIYQIGDLKQEPETEIQFKGKITD